MPTKVSKRIDDLFQKGKLDQSVVLDVLGKLHENQEHAARAVARYFVLFLTFWTVFAAIGSGIVKEGSFSAVKIGDPRDALIVAPLLQGGIFYLLAAALWTNVRLQSAIGRFYKHIAPQFYELDLENLLYMPTLFNTESTFDYEFQESSFRGFNAFWIELLMWSVLAGTGISVLHVSYLLVSSSVYTITSVVLVIAAAIALWGRGLALWFGLSKTSR
jgi:hypothetical protein